MTLDSLIKNLNNVLPDADCTYRYIKWENASYNADLDEYYGEGWSVCSKEQAEKIEIIIRAWDCEYVKRYIVSLQSNSKDFDNIYYQSILDCEEVPE